MKKATVDPDVELKLLGGDQSQQLQRKLYARGLQAVADLLDSLIQPAIPAVCSSADGVDDMPVVIPDPLADRFLVSRRLSRPVCNESLLLVHGHGFARTHYIAASLQCGVSGRTGYGESD